MQRGMVAASEAPDRRAAAMRLLWAGAILLTEYLALSFAFDAYVVSRRGGVWTVFGHAGAVGPFLVAAGAALLLVGPSLVTSRLPKLGPVRLLPAALHLLTTAVFFWATHALFDGEQAPAGPALLWLLGWAFLGLTSFASLLLASIGDLGWAVAALSRALLAGACLGFLAWGAGLLAGVLWGPLSAATFRATAWLLSTLGADLEIDFDEHVLGLQGFRIAVAPVCSGIEGLGLFLVLMTGFLVQQRKRYRFPQALLLLPAGMVLTWLGNCARIAALMLLGAHVDPDVAIGSFHSKAGWVFFCAITIGMAAISRRLPWVTQPRNVDRTAPVHNPVAAWIVPLLSWIAASLVLSALSNGHDPLYPLRVTITGAVLFAYRDRYLGLLQRPSAQAWLAGIAVGIAWLLVPTSAESVPPVPTWSNLPYYAWLVARTIGTVVIVPIAEELAFRGYLARLLSKQEFQTVSFSELTPFGILTSSLAFGALHERWELATITGVIYAVVCRSSGRLVDAVAAHAASNAVIAIWVLSTQSWQHW